MHLLNSTKVLPDDELYKRSCALEPRKGSVSKKQQERGKKENNAIIKQVSITRKLLICEFYLGKKGLRRAAGGNLNSCM